MLRLRLFYGLLTMTLLLWGVGAASMVLMRECVTRFDSQLQSDYQPIDAAQTIRTLTATLNATYLPSLAGPPPAHAPDRMMYEHLKKAVEDKLQIIRSKPIDEEHWQGVMMRLDQVINSYFAGYEKFFTMQAVTQDERERLIVYMGSQTQRLTDLTENVMTLAEAKLFGGTAQIIQESSKNTLFVVTLVLLGTSIAALIYSQLIRSLVDPVRSLERSIDLKRKMAMVTKRL